MVSVKFKVVAHVSLALVSLICVGGLAQAQAQAPKSGQQDTSAVGKADILPEPAQKRSARTAISVVMDQAMLVRGPEAINSVLVGNSSIADAVQVGKGTLLVTGKAYGSTNFILLDKEGKVIGESLVTVGPAKARIVRVQKGDTRESYSCNPNCVPTADVGTSPNFFSEATSQAQQKYGSVASGR